MMRVIVLLFTVLAACAQVPPEGAKRASVETRPVPDARAALGRTPAPARGAAENKSVHERPWAAEPSLEPSEGAELRRTIERQSRRIAELESRGAAADPESRQVVELVVYAHRAAGMRPEEQAHELAAANQGYARDPGPYSRLRLALLLSTPGTAFYDDVRAASLLDPIASQAAKSPLRQFAVLVHGLISERIREQKRVAQLKEQIEGLRAIDRALIDREQGRAP